MSIGHSLLYKHNFIIILTYVCIKTSVHLKVPCTFSSFTKVLLKHLNNSRHNLHVNKKQRRPNKSQWSLYMSSKVRHTFS